MPAPPPGPPKPQGRGPRGPGVCGSCASDHGAGMSAGTLARVGEPFFTTKDPGRGMGLGIFLVRALTAHLGGELSIDSVRGRGTTVTMRLPRQIGAADPSPSAQETP